MDQEATLREVLREVSLLDVAQIAKGAFTYAGCMGIFVFPMAIGTEAFADWAGVDRTNFGIPPWVFWAFIIWVAVWCAGSVRSHHSIEFSWFFPRVTFLGSLLCTAYLLGCYWLYIGLPAPAADLGVRLGYMALVAAYTLPAWCSLALLQIGYRRVIEKRRGSGAAAHT